MATIMYYNIGVADTIESSASVNGEADNEDIQGLIDSNQ